MLNDMLNNMLTRYYTNRSNFKINEYFTCKRIFQHFVIGFISGLMGARLWPVLLLHLIWEIYTNTSFGKEINKKYFGTDYSDRFIEETILDNLLFASGWAFGVYSTDLNVFKGILTQWKSITGLTEIK